MADEKDESSKLPETYAEFVEAMTKRAASPTSKWVAGALADGTRLAYTRPPRPYTSVSPAFRFFTDEAGFRAEYRQTPPPAITIIDDPETERARRTREAYYRRMDELTRVTGRHQTVPAAIWPVQISKKFVEWMAKIEGGWRPNVRIRRMGWDDQLEFFGAVGMEESRVLVILFKICKGRELSETDISRMSAFKKRIEKEMQ